uniref:EF-hand domain-containing protein n=1 Tax=Arcella intermedia TaxID=1963864 RepID=A0A6B2LPG7_9EUKA
MSEDQIHHFKECFRLFDKNGRDQILSSDLGNVFRALGQNPTEAELEAMTQEVNGDVVEFSEFLSLIAKHIKTADTEEDIMEAFKVFDKNNTGEISASELKRVLTSIGEKLSDDEFEEIMKDCNVDQNGKIQYHALVKLMREK